MSKQSINETMHLFATIGARTERGGKVAHVSTNATIDNLGLAVVGDIVAYEDGTEATIVDGAGFAATWGNRPVHSSDHG
ncbi:PAAR domain-containing protein [Burkholderia stabilis]